MGSRLRDTVRFLFELFCEVSPGDHVREPYIVRKYPETYKNEEELKNIPKFTFPCQFENTFVQHYSFVLTSVDSKYTFCFCRYDPKTNTALVLLSHLPWHDIFYKLLSCAAALAGGERRAELAAFLDACRARPPPPGHALRVTYDAGRGVFACQRPDHKLPTIPENCNLTEYFSAVDAKCMAGLWAALLHERRVAVVASKPARLSACVQAANATLFPMSWQHIFIPILPRHLADYLLAPMPFLIGVPRCVMQTVRMSEVGDVVVLDVDANELRTPFRDLESLPQDMVASLRRALSDKHALGDAVSRAFLRALVGLIGGYRDAIRIEKGQLITFNPEAFVRTRKHMQPFLKKILQSQIFQQFIDERLELLNSGRGFSDEFEAECNVAGAAPRTRTHYREWARALRKEGGALLRSVKDKANPAVQSAVKTVRQGGKNMKSAVKGLKNKMPKTSSRPSSINTIDESRLSSESSSSSGSPSGSPPRSPAPLPLELLSEMELLLGGAGPSAAERAKTLTPCPPPRPAPPLRYPIVSTRTLVDVSDAPAPPPRAHAAPVCARQETRSAGVAGARASTLRFSGDALRLTLSSRAPAARAPPPAAPQPGGADLISLGEPARASDSALLHEYGLDFSRFGLAEPAPAAPRGWTTFD